MRRPRRATTSCSAAATISTWSPTTSSTSPPSSSSATVRFTNRSDGDLAVGSGPAQDELEQRRRSLVDLPWTWLRQVHGARVVTVTRPGEHAGAQADAAVTAVPGAVLAIHVADCAPIALVSPEGVVGAVHAGWRGLEAGVVGAAVDAMRALGAQTIEARLGPCIGPECYEFGAADLDAVAARLGDAVRATTAEGRPALDVAAGVAAALDRAGVPLLPGARVCTACSRDHFSHRARAETGRQAVLVWLEER